MPAHKVHKPRLPSNYYVWSEPPDGSGDESLHFVSERRRIKLKGHSFREFERRVIPLLDGEHTVEEIAAEVADVYAPADLEAGLELLTSQNLLEEGASDGVACSAAVQLIPQLNFFHEMGFDAAGAQRRLHDAVVTVFGLGGAGASVAQALAASGVGTLRCVDDLPVSATDVYLTSAFLPAEVGEARTAAVVRKLGEAAPGAKVTAVSESLGSDEDVLSQVKGSSFVACCLDAGQSSLIYKLNRACLKAGIRWTSCALSGTEVIVGPTVYPFETPCYLCFKMRIVACAGNPEDGFAFERFLDRRKRDDSGRRENTVFGAGLAANLLALEVVKEVGRLMPAATRGRVVIFDLLNMSCSKHVVLRKPWCPACFRNESEAPPER